MTAKKSFVAFALVIATVLGGSVAVGDGPRVEAACAISSALRLGSSGEPVRCLQTTLNAQGYSAGPVDGQFGPMTYRAVFRYQQAKRLFVDGVVGRQTGTALGIWGTASASGASSGGTASSGGGAAPAGGVAGCTINTSLRRGSSGAQVQCLQSRLTALGYPVGPIDGVFGNMTRSGVVRYQQAKGLLADGVVGRITGTSLGIWGASASGAAGATGGSTTPAQCTPPSGVPVERAKSSSSRRRGVGPTSTCWSSAAGAGRVRGRTCPAGSDATGCGRWPTAARATAPRRAACSRLPR